MNVVLVVSLIGFNDLEYFSVSCVSSNSPDCFIFTLISICTQLGASFRAWIETVDGFTDILKSIIQ